MHMSRATCVYNMTCTTTCTGVGSDAELRPEAKKVYAISTLLHLCFKDYSFSEL